MPKYALLILSAIAVAMVSGCASLGDAIQQNDVATVRTMLAEGASVNGPLDGGGKPPLVSAAELGHTEIVRLLLERGARIEAVDKDGDTALANAAWKGHAETVRLLLQNGANVNSASAFRNTPLLLAVRRSSQTSRLLIENGADVRSANKDGETPLGSAAYNGLTDILGLLLDKGADIEAVDKYGDTALINASIKGYTEAARLLIDNGANVNVVNKNSDTPLLFAAWKGHTEIAKLLMQGGADFTVRNRGGKTALDLAKDGNHLATYSAILELQRSRAAAAQKKPAARLSPKLAAELKTLVARNNPKELKAFLDAHPEALASIEDPGLRLMYTGPAQLRVIDVARLAKSRMKDALIIAQINSTSAPYKKFDVDELAALQNMAISDDVIAAMVNVTTEYEKEQQRRRERERIEAANAAVQPTQQAQQAIQQPEPPPQQANTPVECLKLVAAIKACDQTGGLMGMACKAAARSQFDCPIPVERLLR